MEESKVYFTNKISKENLVKMYNAIGVRLPGKVAVKVHSGEDGNQNYLKPEFMEDIVKYVNGTIVECNTAYPGARNTTEKHKELIKKHGWTNLYNVDIMDSEGEIKLEVPEGKRIKENYVGSHLKNYDSMLVISHFKGHPMGGFGGALKNISIGVASSNGKANIHSAGKTNNPEKLWDNLPEQNCFLESMADADKSIINYFKENIVFISIMCNMSVDCDCCAVAEDPCMKDIGILASKDPVALDQACIDLVYSSDDPGKDHFIERVESRNGIHTIEAAEKVGVGSRKYELIKVE